jgi:endonuclease/exonuclease/phosphatase family metal-dependent hydrolase
MNAMKKSHLFVIFYAILFLFFIQMSGTLVASIYTLDLMHTSLDAKVLGVLFFFSPILLLPYRKKVPNKLAWSMLGLLFLARGVTPYLNTLGRMLSSGIGTGAILILFILLAEAKPKDESRSQVDLWVSAGLALSVGLSVLLRTINFSLDYSLTPGGGWVGWVLGAMLGMLITQVEWVVEPGPEKNTGGLTGAAIGIFLVLALVYFSFSAPAVISRWTEGNYVLIVIVISLMVTGYAWLAFAKPGIYDRVSPGGLAGWNVAFTLSLVGTILAHRVSFPRTPNSAAVVVGVSSWMQQLPLVLMLILFPVILLDMRIFVSRIRQAKPSMSQLVSGFLLGSGTLVLLVFMNIFTNVWGYIAPISTIFRNLYWLPFLLIAGVITILVSTGRKSRVDPAPVSGKFQWGWALLLGIVFLGSGVGALRSVRPLPADPLKTSLLVMTYNIQAGNDVSGEQSYDRQLALIRKVSPDILALQETDTTRISLNNNDYVRYFASQLGYYSYYGPTTVAGTFGTAILSKYPLMNTDTVFTFSDQDEIGTAEAEIEVSGHIFNIYDVHPDGSDTAKMVFAQTLLERSKGKANVIAMGDYNLRDYEAAYQLIASVYANAWVSVYPTKISSDGTDMSGDNRIDHIFVSPSISIRNPVYLLPPASATDHAVHWAEISWGK